MSKFILPSLTKYKSTIFSCVLSLLTIVVLTRGHTDPDLGWHLRNGQDILKYGVPQGDYYSYTMSGYPWISHEWLTDVLLFITSQHLGFIFLSVFFALLVFAAYFISASAVRAKLSLTFLMVLISALVAMSIVGVRAQMLTLLGVATTLWLLFRWRDNPKNNLIYWLIPLFLFWVNLHGGFAAGLLIIGLFWLIELIKYLLPRRFIWNKGAISLTPCNLITLVIVGLLSFFATFVNPYTWRVYQELFSTIFNDLVKNGITEWLPVSLNSTYGYNLLAYAIFVVLILIFSWRKADITKIIISAVFLVISISSWRHLPLFSLVTLPLLVEIVQGLFPKGIDYYVKSSLVLLGVVVVLVVIGSGISKTVLTLNNSEFNFGDAGRYPYGAVQYLKEHPLKGNMLNEYNWGGYLIWKLPEKRVFIDGRMAIWKTPTQNMFADYLSLSKNENNTSAILEKYKIEFALIYADRKLKDYFLFHSDQWKLVYQDKLAMIFGNINAD